MAFSAELTIATKISQSSRPIPVALWHAHSRRATMAGQTNINTQAGMYTRELLSVGVALMLVARTLASAAIFEGGGFLGGFYDCTL